MAMNRTDRPWDVLLIGGPSGVGKTSVSYRIAQAAGVGITEVDDLFIAVESMTTPEQQPEVHYWRTTPDAAKQSAEAILDIHLRLSNVLAPMLVNVIENHLETNVPLVLDGDYMLPSLLATKWQNPGIVTGVFLIDRDERQYLENYAAREPAAGHQHKRAAVSFLFGEWLRHECASLGVPAIEARPWETLIERVVAATAPRGGSTAQRPMR